MKSPVDTATSASFHSMFSNEMDLPFVPRCRMCERIEALDNTCSREWIESTDRANRRCGTVGFTHMMRRYRRRLDRCHWLRMAMHHPHLEQELSNYTSTMLVADADEQEPSPTRTLVVL